MEKLGNVNFRKPSVRGTMFTGLNYGRSGKNKSPAVITEHVIGIKCLKTNFRKTTKSERTFGNRNDTVYRFFLQQFRTFSICNEVFIRLLVGQSGMFRSDELLSIRYKGH